jgi:hypothetical protein
MPAAVAAALVEVVVVAEGFLLGVGWGHREGGACRLQDWQEQEE